MAVILWLCEKHPRPHVDARPLTIHSAGKMYLGMKRCTTEITSKLHSTLPRTVKPVTKKHITVLAQKNELRMAYGPHSQMYMLLGIRAQLLCCSSIQSRVSSTEPVARSFFLTSCSLASGITPSISSKFCVWKDVTEYPKIFWDS